MFKKWSRNNEPPCTISLLDGYKEQRLLSCQKPESDGYGFSSERYFKVYCEKTHMLLPYKKQQHVTEAIYCERHLLQNAYTRK